MSRDRDTSLLSVPSLVAVLSALPVNPNFPTNPNLTGPTLKRIDSARHLFARKILRTHSRSHIKTRTGLMNSTRRESAKHSCTLLTDSTSSQLSARGRKILSIEFSSWEGKQQAELTQLRATTTVLSLENGDLRKKHGAADVELRHAHRLIEALKKDNDTLHKKCDSNDRRANHWEMDLHKRHEQAIGRKASEEKSGYELRSEADKAKEPRVVKCSQCYIKKWPCDAGYPCQACIARGIPGGCKRVKCQFWTKGTCPKRQCGLAHEDDGFPMVVEHRKLKQKLTAMPAEVKKTLTAPAVGRPRLDADTQQRHTTPYDPMDQTPDLPTVNNRISLRVHAFTGQADYLHRSLEEYRVHDYNILGRRYTQYAERHNQNSSFNWDRRFPGGPLQVVQEQKKVESGFINALPIAASPTVPSMLDAINTAFKKHGRDDGDVAGGGHGNTKRAKLNTANPNPNHVNISTAAFPPNPTMQQAQIVQEAQLLDLMDQDSDPENGAGLRFMTFTVAPDTRHQSLEEYRVHDYAGGYRPLYYPGGMSGIHCLGGCCTIHRPHSQANVAAWSTSFPGGPLEVAQGRK
ncbi:hypothetical protein P171DRAFT_468356 [Karstenula rhodostoma CBS 690.94]|uniref:C3H1-type domain-containing protein n=1 Tax=Karstenula rhodostoma CBS 690.94 TaxID=1392251 RepID=A0A9P4PV45_9PLEO|nr:hypothetical protein P171DRAFT_468356 [Karstenula rhodostoma CBS 690.94]